MTNAPVVVSLSDLEDALAWVSGPPEFETAAFVSRTTGQIHLRSEDGPVTDDFPDDIDDGTTYLAVPHKNDLDLGRDLVFRFVGEAAPELLDEVHGFFRKKGAYARFKAALERRRLLDDWHTFERRETLKALADWAAEHGLSTA